MTDEQILKRLAEIEGLIKTEGFVNANGWYWHINRKSFVQYSDDTMLPGKVTRQWNPLNNPADTYALIEKHEVMLWPCDMGWCAECKGIGIDHESLPHAICLAIIEANGGMGDG